MLSESEGQLDCDLGTCLGYLCLPPVYASLRLTAAV